MEIRKHPAQPGPALPGKGHHGAPPIPPHLSELQALGLGPQGSDELDVAAIAAKKAELSGQHPTVAFNPIVPASSGPGGQLNLMA